MFSISASPSFHRIIHPIRRCANRHNAGHAVDLQYFECKIAFHSRSFLHVIMQAVNGPLQHRTAVLDLDFSRANTFPEDYDTDLELDWANPSTISFFSVHMNLLFSRFIR